MPFDLSFFTISTITCTAFFLPFFLCFVLLSLELGKIYREKNQNISLALFISFFFPTPNPAIFSYEAFIRSHFFEIIFARWKFQKVTRENVRKKNQFERKKKWKKRSLLIMFRIKNESKMRFWFEFIRICDRWTFFI